MGTQLQSVVELIGRVWSLYQAEIKTVGTALGTVSGWVYHAWRKRQDEKPLFSLEADGGSVFAVNHGVKSVEILHGSLALSDPMAKAEFAKKHHFMVGMAGSVQPNERKKILEIDDGIAQAVLAIAGPRERVLAEYGGVSLAPNLVRCELFLACCVVGRLRVQSAYFDRWLSGRPGAGWALGYSPYYHKRAAGVFAETRERVKAAVGALLRPKAYLRERKWKRALAEHLTVMGIIRAIRDKTISEEEGERRLTKLAKRARVPPVEFFEKHMKQAEDQHKANLELARKGRDAN